MLLDDSTILLLEIETKSDSCCAFNVPNPQKVRYKSKKITFAKHTHLMQHDY